MHGSAPWGGRAADAAVLHLCADQAVLLEREPTNEADSNAVCIKTVPGAVLGYVPADMTHLFPSTTILGRVQSVGRVGGTGNWGAKVRNSATDSSLASAVWV